MTAIVITDETPPDAVGTALAEITTKYESVTQYVETGRELHATYKDVAWDCSTTKGMEEAKAARLALREKARYPLQHLADEISKALGTMQRQANARTKELIAELVAYEKPIHDQIEAEETRKENERKAREAAAAAVRAKRLEEIGHITALVADAAGGTPDFIAALIKAAQDTVINAETFGDCEGMALQARDDAVAQLKAMHTAAVETEEEKAQIEAMRLRQAHAAAALAADREVFNRERAAFEAEKRAAAERQAEQDRIAREQEAERQRQKEATEKRHNDNLRALAMHCLCSVEEGSAVLRAHLTRLESARPTAADFGVFLEDAQQLVAGAITEYTAALETAVKRERIAQVEGYFAAMRDVIGMCKPHDSVAQLRTAMEALLNVDITPANFDDRSEEAETVRTEGVNTVRALLEAAVERDIRIHEEAAAKLREEEVEAQARAKSMRLASKAPVMFDLLGRVREFLDELEGGGVDGARSKQGDALAEEIRVLQRDLESDDAE